MSGEWIKVEQGSHDFKTEPKLEGELVEIQDSRYEGHNYLVKKENGDLVLIFGKTALQSKMSNIKLGTQIRIEFLGNKLSPKTGRTYQDYDVQYKKSTDDEQDIEA